jgi:hypothetical protein
MNIFMILTIWGNIIAIFIVRSLAPVTIASMSVGMINTRFCCYLGINRRIIRRSITIIGNTPGVAYL